jgi:hypothetical protein
VVECVPDAKEEKKKQKELKKMRQRMQQNNGDDDGKEDDGKEGGKEDESGGGGGGENSDDHDDDDDDEYELGEDGVTIQLKSRYGRKKGPGLDIVQCAEYGKLHQGSSTYINHMGGQHGGRAGGWKKLGPHFDAEELAEVRSKYELV